MEMRRTHLRTLILPRTGVVLPGARVMDKRGKLLPARRVIAVIATHTMATFDSYLSQGTVDNNNLGPDRISRSKDSIDPSYC